MKRYKLKKDLPTFGTGDIFTLADNGNLYKDIGEQVPICAYASSTLKKFPNILTDWFEEIPEEPKTVDDLEVGDKYYTIFFEKCGDIVEKTWNDDQTDYSLRSFGLCYLTPEEAEKEAARWRARTILERDTKGFKPDWNNNDQNKWYVTYQNYFKGQLVAERTQAYNYGPLTFGSWEAAEASIKAHPNEWKTYLGVEE